jgi:hypothetical protein
VLIANDRDPIPFVSFISTKTRTVLGTLAYPQVVFGKPAVGHAWNNRSGTRGPDGSIWRFRRRRRIPMAKSMKFTRSPGR